MYHPTIDIKNNSIFGGADLFFDIFQIGCGGNGGYLVQRLSKMLYAFQQNDEAFRFSYTLIDGDTVESSNLGRQPFIQEDLNQKKAKVLAERYSEAYSIPIFYRDQYIESADDIIDYLTKQVYEYFCLPIIIGCVDNNATRQILHQVFERLDDVIYLDSGIDSIDTDAPFDEQVEMGYSGQVVCGYKTNGHVLLAPVGVVYENILNDKDSLLPTQACGVTVVNYPQRMQTNEMAACVLAGYLNTILGEKRIVSHYTNFNARTMLCRPTYIKKEK